MVRSSREVLGSKVRVRVEAPACPLEVTLHQLCWLLAIQAPAAWKVYSAEVASAAMVTPVVHVDCDTPGMSFTFSSSWQEVMKRAATSNSHRVDRVFFMSVIRSDVNDSCFGLMATNIRKIGYTPCGRRVYLG